MGLPLIHATLCVQSESSSSIVRALWDRGVVFVLFVDAPSNGSAFAHMRNALLLTCMVKGLWGVEPVRH